MYVVYFFNSDNDFITVLLVCEDYMDACEMQDAYESKYNVQISTTEKLWGLKK
jgi:hypothetical protein